MRGAVGKRRRKANHKRDKPMKGSSGGQLYFLELLSLVNICYSDERPVELWATLPHYYAHLLTLKNTAIARP